MVQIQMLLFINNLTDNENTIGMYSNQNIDAYQYSVRPYPYDENIRVTKRVVLSEISSVFDPLGLISPIIIKLKIIILRLWQVNTSWDAALPSDIEKDWIDSRRKMIDLNTTAINRSIVGDDEIADIQLRGFSDSSETAYVACLYLFACGKY